MYINEAYDYITEATRSLPDWIRVVYWAISYHYNSPKTDDGEIQPSHIGNYFSTIRFNDYSLTNKDAQLTMYYTGNIKSNIAHGSTTITDIRPFTIEYRFDGKEEIKDIIADDEKLQQCLEKGAPSLSIAKILHEIATEYVRYAKIYWKNDEQDAVIFRRSQLTNFADELVNSKLLAGSKIKRTGEKRDRIGQAYSVGSCFKFTVPADKVAEFNMLYSKANHAGKIEYGTDDKGDVQSFGWPAGFDHQKQALENGDVLHAIASIGPFAYKFASLINDAGLTKDGIQTIKLATASQRKDMLGITPGKDPANKTARTSSSRPTAEKATEITLAFDAESFERGAKLCGVFVKKYQLSHPKNKTTIDIDDNAQSVNITGMSSNEIKSMTEFFDKKNITYTEM